MFGLKCVMNEVLAKENLDIIIIKDNIFRHFIVKLKSEKKKLMLILSDFLIR